MSKLLQYKRAKRRAGSKGGGIDPVARVNEISRAARTSWLGLLGYLAFAGVTLLGVEDADFFLPDRQTTLPLVGVDIPTGDFFVFGPILAAALFIYFHIYLFRLWAAMAAAPHASDGEFGDRIFPWLINDLGLWFRSDRVGPFMPVSALSVSVTLILAFGLGPLVLAVFWVMYWPAHDVFWSTMAGVLCVVCLSVALASFALARRALAPGSRHVNRGSGFGAAMAFCLAIGVSAAVSNLKTVGPGGWAGQLLEGSALSESLDDWMGLARADLRGVELVPKPPNWKSYDAHLVEFRADWCRRGGLAPDLCGEHPILGDPAPPYQAYVRAKWCGERDLDEAGCVALFSDLETGFVAAWKTEREDHLEALPALDLRGVDLRRADLREAFFPGADLRNAKLDGADMSEAQAEYVRLEDSPVAGLIAENADFRVGRFGRINLQDSRFRGSDFQLADFAGQNTSRTVLNAVDFSQTILDLTALDFVDANTVDFRFTDLLGTSFTNSNLERADFTSSEFFGPDFGGTTFVLGDFWFVKFHDARLLNTTFDGSLLSNAQFFRGHFQNVTFQNSYLTNTRALDSVKSWNIAAATSLARVAPLGLGQTEACWAEPPQHFDELVELRIKHSPAARRVGTDVARETFVGEWLCDPPGSSEVENQ